MIDFKNGSFFKLKMISSSTGENMISPLLIDDENVISAYGSLRDYVIFTNKRIVAVNVQGVTGKKKDFSSLPYAKIIAFSVETSGHFDLDSELELWFSGLGKVKFEFTGNSNIVQIGKLIGSYALK